MKRQTPFSLLNFHRMQHSLGFVLLLTIALTGLLGCSAERKTNPDAIKLNKSGLASLNKGEYDTAIQDFTEVIRLEPKVAMAYSNRGNAWDAKGDFSKAIRDYREAISLDPELADVYNNLSFLLAASPDAGDRNGMRAVEAGLKACELSDWKNSTYIATLAIAYAESGNFEQAVKYEKQMLEMLDETVDKTPYLKRLELFQQGKPYHITP